MRITSVVAAAALTAVLAVSAGCSSAPEPTTQPTVTPPAIAEAGTIKVGVDLSQPPYAGVDAGRKAGIDIDVAAAMADRLGLKVVYVDIKPSDAATALAEGKVDAVMSVPLADAAALTQLTLAGSYLDDGPALFAATDSTASVEPSVTLENASVDQIAVQEGSESFWLLRSELDSSSISPYDSLRAAIEALDAGTEKMVAGDALTGAYIARDFPKIRLVGQLRDAAPLAVAVGAENAALSDAVRTALDSLAADGVLDAIRTKWVGDLPELQTGASAEATDTSAEQSATP